MTLESLMGGVDWTHMARDLKQRDEIYMLCPVRKATQEEKEFLEAYKQEMIKRGFRAHYPATDTNQDSDGGGYRICMDHCDEENRAAQIHIFWNTSSTGSYVDLGTCLFLHWDQGKKIKLINRSDVEKTVSEHEAKGIKKSYEHVLLHLDNLAEKNKS